MILKTQNSAYETTLWFHKQQSSEINTKILMKEFLDSVVQICIINNKNTLIIEQISSSWISKDKDKYYNI